jgi:hypothetical protein
MIAAGGLRTLERPERVITCHSMINDDYDYYDDDD